MNPRDSLYIWETPTQKQIEQSAIFGDITLRHE